MKNTILPLSIFLLCCITKVAAQPNWTLQECIAYGRSHSMAAQENRVLNRQLTEDKKMISALYMPQLSATTGTVYGNGYQTTEGWQFNAGLNVSTILFAGGRKYHQLKKADLMIAQSDFDIALAENDIELQVLYAYTNALAKKEQYHAAVDLYNKAVQLRKHLEDEGKLTKEGDGIFSSLLQQDLQDIESLGQQYEMALMNIKQIINISENTVIQLEPINSAQPSCTNINEALVKAIKADPLISKNEIDIAIAKKDVAIAKTFLYPGIAAQYSPYYNYSTGYNYFTEGMQHYAGLQVTIPIFYGRSQQSAVKRAVVNLQYQETRFENQIEAMDNAVRFILREFANKENIQASALKSLQSTTQLLEEAVQKLKILHPDYEAYLVLRNWQKQNTLQWISLKYDTITQAKLIDFYIGAAL